MQVSENKFIKVIERYKDYSDRQIRKYVKKGIKYLYFEKKDHIKFLTVSSENLVKIFNDPTVSAHQVYKTQIRAMGIVHEYLRNVGVNEQLGVLIRALVDSFMIKYVESRSLTRILIEFPLLQNDISEKSSLLAYVCEAITDDLRWNSDTIRTQLGLASIFHDCMLENDELTIETSLDSPIVKILDENELRNFKDHPSLGANVAKFLQGFPEFDFLVLQHHEQPSGIGFPLKMEIQNLTKLSALFIVANHFVSELMNREFTIENISDILEKLYKIYTYRTFKEPLACLYNRLLIDGK